MDAEKVLGLNSSDLLEIDKILSSVGNDSEDSKIAVEITSKIKKGKNFKEGDTTKVLRLITNAGIDAKRLGDYSSDRLLLLTNFDNDPESAKTAFKVSERFVNNVTKVNGKDLSDVALELCSDIDIGLDVETLDLLTSVEESSEAILVGLNRVFTKTGIEKVKAAMV